MKILPKPPSKTFATLHIERSYIQIPVFIFIDGRHCRIIWDEKKVSAIKGLKLIENFFIWMNTWGEYFKSLIADLR